MNKITFQLIIVFFLCISVDGLAQKNVLIDSIKVANFSNEFLLNGKQGKIYIISSDSLTDKVIVRWNNGYIAFGNMDSNKVDGNWSLYDRKHRIRAYYSFYSNGQCLFYSKKLNKKGKTISQFTSTTLCF